MRILCCGYHQKGSRVEFFTLPQADHEDLKRMAYAKGLWIGDLLGALLKPAIEEWRQSQAAEDDETAALRIAVTRAWGLDLIHENGFWLSFCDAVTVSDRPSSGARGISGMC
ncbi:hypothetical protein STANM309S_06467 [Streptomyces tanashiensis]